jgi:hypothetical protein
MGHPSQYCFNPQHPGEENRGLADKLHCKKSQSPKPRAGRHKVARRPSTAFPESGFPNPVSGIPKAEALRATYQLAHQMSMKNQATPAPILREPSGGEHPGEAVLPSAIDANGKAKVH